MALREGGTLGVGQTCEIDLDPPHVESEAMALGVLGDVGYANVRDLDDSPRSLKV